jgi:hypothetical protein
MEVDGLVNGLAVGKYLWVKVRMPIDKPLMRGTTVEVDDGGKTIWCPFEYEYLPNFCFICGVIGHLDRECSSILKKGEDPQFGKWLRWLPPKKHNFFDTRRGWSDGGGGRRQTNWGSGGSKHSSDGPSWRKENALSKVNEKVTEVGEKEVSNLLAIKVSKEKGEKTIEPKGLEGKPSENIFAQWGVTGCAKNNFLEEGVEGMHARIEDDREFDGKSQGKTGAAVNEDTRTSLENNVRSNEGAGDKKPICGKEGKKAFKRQLRKDITGVATANTVMVGMKRGVEDMDMEVDTTVRSKKAKEGVAEIVGVVTTNKTKNAGLSQQLRGQK